MNKNILLIIGVIILIIGAAVFWVMQRDGQSQSPGQTDATVPADWQLYQNSEFGFELQHPPTATVQQEDEIRIKFTYLGGPQATGEVTDGFTFTVGTHQLTANQSLGQFANMNYQEQLQVGTSVQEPTQVSLHGRTAYYYRVETLGEIDVYVVTASDANRAHTISYNVADPNNQNYQTMVDTMVETFRVIPVQENDVSDVSDGSGNDNGVLPTTSTVSLAMLEVGDDGEGERYGCDYLTFVERDISSTSAPLTASMRELFSIATTSVNGYYNFIANTNDTLAFERAEVANGTASIYLTGELSGLTGVCDDPRARIQIEQTALQFETVDEVQIYLNGQMTNLQPNQRGEE